MKGERRMAGRIFRLLEIDRILTHAYRGENTETMLSVKEIFEKLKDTDPIKDLDGKDNFELYPKEEKTVRKDLELFRQLQDYLNQNNSRRRYGYEIIEKEKRDEATGRNVKCYAIPPEKSMFQHGRSDWETEILKSLIDNLDQFDVVKDFGEMIELPEDKKLKLRNRSSNIPPVIDLNIVAPEHPALLVKLVEAITEGKILKIKYRKIKEIDQDNIVLKPGEKRTEIILPLQLKRFNNRWVLLASVEANNFIVNFTLDQIESIEYTEKTFSAGARLRVRNLFRDVVGPTLPREKSSVKSDNPIYQPTNEDDGLRPVDVIFYALPYRVKHIERFPIMDGGVQKDITASFTVAEIEFLKDKYKGGKVFKLENVYVTRELMEELFKRMDDLVVLSPSALREEMKNKITSLHNFYCNGG